MTAPADPIICTVDGCSTTTSDAIAEPRPPIADLELNIVSDTICPWCFVGKRRIDRAIEELATEGLTVRARWLPFELNPNMPVAGMDRREYRSAKFGSWAHSQSFDAQVAAEGAREGIVFQHGVILGLLLPRARRRRPRGAVRRWVAGRSAPHQVAALLRGDDGLVEVIQHETWATSAGIHGVPSVIARNLLLFSGAQRTPLIVKALRRIVPAQAAAQAELGGAQADARA